MPSNAARIARSLALFEERLFEPVALADLARRAAFSPFHFHRLFTALVGRPPMDHLRRRRPTEAAHRLLSTSRPIVQVAFDCQFTSQEAFTRAFERLHGTPPGAFRRRGRPSTRGTAAVQETIDFVWGTWLPRSDYEPASTPDFERYDERFDGETGEGELDVYVPIR